MLKEDQGFDQSGPGEPIREATSRPFTDRYLASLKPRCRRDAVLDPRRQGLMLRITEAGFRPPWKKPEGESPEGLYDP